MAKAENIGYFLRPAAKAGIIGLHTIQKLANFRCLKRFHFRFQFPNSGSLALPPNSRGAQDKPRPKGGFIFIFILEIQTYKEVSFLLRERKQHLAGHFDFNRFQKSCFPLVLIPFSLFSISISKVPIFIIINHQRHHITIAFNSLALIVGF